MSFIFVYGRPGTGKTTFAASAAGTGHKVLFIDIDQKVEGMRNLDKWRKDIIVWPVEQKLLEATLKTKILQPQLAILKQPKGYLQFCNYIEQLEQAQEAPASVLVIDSLTSLIEHLKRLICHLAKKDKLTFDEWGILLANLEELFYTLMSLQRLFKHVIVIAHEQAERDEDTGRILAILPAIEGSMRNKVSKYFAEVYRADTLQTKGKTEYILHTRPADKAEARSSLELPDVIPADFAYIEGRLNGAKTQLQ